jgi:hypothetical protein
MTSLIGSQAIAHFPVLAATNGGADKFVGSLVWVFWFLVIVMFAGLLLSAASSGASHLYHWIRSPGARRQLK